MTAVMSVQQQRTRYAQAKEALWGKPRVVNRAAEIKRREAELERLIEERRAAARLQWQREQEERRRLAEEKAEKERIAHELATRPQPTWDEIAPNLVNGTMEEITNQVLAYFPQYTFETVTVRNRVKKRANVLRLICTAIKTLNPEVPVTAIGEFVGRDHSTVTWLLMGSHLGKKVIRRPSYSRSKLAPFHDEIRSMHLSGMTQGEIADEFGVAQSAVCRLIAKKGWKRE